MPAAGSHPAASAQQPAASSQQPAASSYMPAASSQQPAPSSQRPAASSQQPAASSKKPAATSQQPSASSQQHLQKLWLRHQKLFFTIPSQGWPAFRCGMLTSPRRVNHLSLGWSAFRAGLRSAVVCRLFLFCLHYVFVFPPLFVLPSSQRRHLLQGIRSVCPVRDADVDLKVVQRGEEKKNIMQTKQKQPANYSGTQTSPKPAADAMDVVGYADAWYATMRQCIHPCL